MPYNFNFTESGYAPINFDFNFGLKQTANLQALINVITVKNLGASIIGKSIYSIANISAYIHGWDTKDLLSYVHGWSAKDLSSSIYSIPPKDLQAILNVIEIRDLPADITGEWWHDQYDLPAEFYKIFMRGEKDLESMIYGLGKLDLPAYITAVYFKDLLAVIQGNDTVDLPSTISPIAPENLQGLIHGWDTRYLQAFINGVYGPYDLRAFLNAISPKDLSAYIRGYKGIQIPFDLQGIVEGWYTSDLPAYLSFVFPADLQAYLNAIGKTADLGASIIPSTILMKRALQIPLLEHKDLGALINFMCFGSAYYELPAYLYALHKLDLPAFIIG